MITVPIPAGADPIETVAAALDAKILYFCRACGRVVDKAHTHRDAAPPRDEA